MASGYDWLVWPPAGRALKTTALGEAGALRECLDRDCRLFRRPQLQGLEELDLPWAV